MPTSSLSFHPVRKGHQAPPFPARQASRDSARDLQALDAIATTITLRRGQALFHEGDPVRSYFRVGSGAIRCSRVLPDGRRQIGDFFLPGDFFDLGAAEIYLHTAEAIADTVLATYRRTALDRAVDEQPRLGRAMLAMMSRRLADTQYWMVVLGRKSAEERVATFLLSMIERCGSGDHLHLPMTRTDMADHLGLTTETVSRTLTKFRMEGVIALKAASDVQVLDHDALTESAEGAGA
jgi:CRP/FNR family transcriptional regulator, anaerobic regulatory protein